jgi:hypothetical protein
MEITMNERAVLMLPEVVKKEIKLYSIGESKLPKTHPLIRILRNMTGEEVKAILDKNGTIVEIEEKRIMPHGCKIKDIAMLIPSNWLANDEGLK